MKWKRDEVLKIIGVIVLLYFFMVAIKLVGTSFKMFGGDFAARLVTSCSNPLVGLFIGILATSIVQSSSTTTSLVVGLVGGGILPLEVAIPMIMGANVGTTITNVLVSLTFVTRREDFKRAFAGATVHDFFNFFAVALFFPLELKFGFIQRSALFLTRMFEGVRGAELFNPLAKVIDPAVHSLKHLLLEMMELPRVAAAIVMVVIAFAVLIVSLLYLVRTMRSLIMGRAEAIIHRYLFRNAASSLLLGMCLTAAVQSSSITTSLIVPLVAAGIITLERCYPCTLGANIGTTCTALLASLATLGAAGEAGATTLGVTAAFAHLIFNVCGIAVFYPLKKLPIWCARRLAERAARNKLWAVLFVAGVFFGLPLVMILVARSLNS